MFHISDWLPTIVEGMVGATLTEPYDVSTMDGINQWDAIMAGTKGLSIMDYPRTEMVINLDGVYDAEHPEAGIRIGNWKLIINSATWG